MQIGNRSFSPRSDGIRRCLQFCGGCETEHLEFLLRESRDLEIRHTTSVKYKDVVFVLGGYRSVRQGLCPDLEQRELQFLFESQSRSCRNGYHSSQGAQF